MKGERGSGLAGYVMETHRYCVVCNEFDWLKNDRCREHQGHLYGPEANLTAHRPEAKLVQQGTAGEK